MILILFQNESQYDEDNEKENSKFRDVRAFYSGVNSWSIFCSIWRTSGKELRK
jgi:hypothetical protein